MKYKIDFTIDFKRNTFPGKFIAIEGIDGSGKTTQAHRLAEQLKKTRSVFLTKNPTDGEIGKFIRKFLRGEIKIHPVSFQYIYSADRQEQQLEVISHLRKGDTVITDRYFWSAIAYGLVDREGLNFDKNGQLLLVAQGILSAYHQFIVPDFTFYLNVSAKAALQRLSKMEKSKELYETQEKLEKIARGYEWLIKKFPEEITVVNGEKSVEEVTGEILSKSLRLLK